MKVSYSEERADWETCWACNIYETCRAHRFSTVYCV